ncbi:MAG: hypothetical protein KBA26_09290 [Candidatus Delongbacteria bacterium]|nr:hypothetical protein [Candidatus Delongbacteria bacterium]
MKRLVMIGIGILWLFGQAMAKDSIEDSSQVLFSRIVSHGGYGGISFQMASINDETGFLVGGYGGWLINHTFMMGIGGYGLVNDVIDDRTILYYDKKMNFGYGGFMMEWICQYKKLIHPTVSCLIGGGAVSTNDLMGVHLDWDNDWDEQSFFVVEPAIHLQLNVARYVRANIGASYRYVSSFDHDGIDQKDVSGFNGRISFLFGKF